MVFLTKITVIGRPSKIVEKGTYMVAFLSSSKVPSLPKGLPTPPSVPTNYVVYIAMKQWNKVAEAIRDEEDVLIVEGFPQHAENAITVFATNTTTKKLQQAQRLAQQQQQAAQVQS